MSTTATATVSDLVRAFDNAQADKAARKARDLRSAHRRQDTAGLRLAVAAVPVGLVVAVVLALV